jgi:hypothetical protein
MKILQREESDAQCAKCALNRKSCHAGKVLAMYECCIENGYFIEATVPKTGDEPDPEDYPDPDQ